MPEFSFSLIFERPEDNESFDRLADDLHEAGCNDALFGARGSEGYLDFYREAEDVQEAVSSAVEDAEKCGLLVTDVRPEMVPGRYVFFKGPKILVLGQISTKERYLGEEVVIFQRKGIPERGTPPRDLVVPEVLPSRIMAKPVKEFWGYVNTSYGIWPRCMYEGPAPEETFDLLLSFLGDYLQPMLEAAKKIVPENLDLTEYRVLKSFRDFGSGSSNQTYERIQMTHSFHDKLIGSLLEKGYLKIGREETEDDSEIYEAVKK